MQDGCDSVALAGYGFTASVVGAPIGIHMEVAGNIISGIGTIVETGVVVYE